MGNAVVCDSFSIKFDSLLVTHNKSLIRLNMIFLPLPKKKPNKMKMSNRNNQKIWFCLRNLLSCCLTAGISVICESSHEACCKFLVGMNGKYLRYQKCHPWLWSIKATRSIEANNWDRFKRKTRWMHLNCILQYDEFFCLWKSLCCRKHLG